MAAAEPKAECAVCWTETAEAGFATLPCCTAPAGSTMRYCQRCVEIICENGPGGVGRCPTCRQYLRKCEGGFEVADRVETCALCRQARVIVGELQGGVPACDGCFLGAQNPLRYECERCRRVQRIPHPMYRYQVDGPNSFGNNTWACSVRCGEFTHWRVHGSDVHLVPAQDAPESWGAQEEFIARVRAQRRREITEGGLAPRIGGAAAGGWRSEVWQLVLPVFLLAIARWWGWV